MAPPNSQSNIPQELATISKEKIDQISEKLNKCYSKEDFQTFTKDVKEIVLATLSSDEGREKIKAKAKEIVDAKVASLPPPPAPPTVPSTSDIEAIVKRVMGEEAFKQKGFYVSLGGLLVSVAALVITVLKP